MKYSTGGQVIDTVTPKRGADLDDNAAVRAEPVRDPGEHTGSWRVVWAYSTKRYIRDNRTLNAQESRTRDDIAGTKSARTPRVVTTGTSPGHRKIVNTDRSHLLGAGQ